MSPKFAYADLIIAITIMICPVSAGKSTVGELIKTCKRANPVITFIPADTLTKFVFGQKAHDLRKDRAALVHMASPSICM